MFNVTKMLTAHGGNIRSMLKNSWEGPGETLHKLCKHFVGYLAGTFLERFVSIFWYFWRHAGKMPWENNRQAGEPYEKNQQQIIMKAADLSLR